MFFRAILLLFVVVTPVKAQLRLNFDQQSGLYGYVDESKKIVIPSRYPGATEFSEGLAAVFIDSAWGYIDTLGHIAIKPVFKSAEEFRQGIAAVGVYRKLEIPVISDSVTEIDWCIWYPGLEWTGAYNEYRHFNEDCVRCPACYIGAIDKKGKFVIQPNYKSVFLMLPGVYKVRKEDCRDNSCYYRLINTGERSILHCNSEFSDILTTTEDLRYFEVRRGPGEFAPAGIINRDCKVVIPFKYYRLGMGPVVDEANPIKAGVIVPGGSEFEPKIEYTYINLKGKQVINLRFDDATVFKNGVAEVYQNGKQFCIKGKGVLLDYCENCDCYRK